jgi:hypothetical protein
MGIMLSITALVLFAFGLYFCCRGKPEIKAIFAAGACCLVFAFLPQFKYFEGYGVKAERLDQKIRDANETITRLTSLSKPLAELLFTITARAGRGYSGIPRRDRYRMMQELESELRKTGLGDKDIEEAKRDWHRFNLYDLSEPVFDDIIARIEEKKKQQQERINALSYPSVSAANHAAHEKEVKQSWHISAEERRLETTRSLENIFSVYDGIMQFLDSTDIFSGQEKQDVLAKNKEELDDLKYYLEHKEFRRLEHWFELEKTDN